MKILLHLFYWILMPLAHMAGMIKPEKTGWHEEDR